MNTDKDSTETEKQILTTDGVETMSNQVIDARHAQLNDLIVGMAEDDPDGTVALITGHFVGLVVSYVAQNSDADECKDIILSGGKRKITIHAPEVCADELERMLESEVHS